MLALFLVSLEAGCATGAIRPRGGPGLEQVMTVTGYCNCGACCGWERTWLGTPVFSSGPNKGKRKPIGITSCGVRARTGTVAADLTRYPYGTVVYVEGYGYGRVEDCGGAIKGDELDLWFPSHSRATDWGKQKKIVRVWLPPGVPAPPPLPPR